MDGIIRWRDLQNILTTEDQINLLYGLTAVAADINRITGFNYTGAELNEAYESVAVNDSHRTQDLANAHPLVPGSIDGGVLADNTVAQSKLNFNIMTDADDLRITNDITQLNTDLQNVDAQVQNLYSIVIPGQANDIADSINQMVEHVEKLKDAHDATAISLGNQYAAIMDTMTGSQQVRVALEHIRFFRVGDDVDLQSTGFGPESKTVTFVNYNTGHFEVDTPVVGDYRVADSFIIHNISQDNVQEGVERSLRNTTDILTGRLTINQDSDDNALDINKTGAGYLARFNDFSAKSNANYTIELGNNDGSSLWELQNSDMRLAAQVLDDGNARFNNVSLEDRVSMYLGQITKQPLTDNRSWMLPDRSGFIGVGDLTFTELLKVRQVVGTKEITVAPGQALDYQGEIMSAWVSMEYPSQYPGGQINIETQFAAQGELLTLGSQWRVFVVYINDTDNVLFQFGPEEATRQEAIDEYENFIPSAFMKLAKIVVQGDGAGGILQSSIEILEDQRPFLTQGMSASYYDETIQYPAGNAAGNVITLPPNSRGGGTNMTYRIGKGQLEVYLDGVYQKVDVDYEEFAGEPLGQIRMLKDIKTNSCLRFRVTFKAAAVAGGLDTPTLQSVYVAGPTMFLSSIYGPITMSSFDMTTLMDIDGDVILQGLLRAVRGIEFFETASAPGDNNTNHLWVDSADQLIYHQNKSGTIRDIDILQEIENSQAAISVTVSNASGVTIPKGRGLTLHPSLTNHVLLCDTSNSLVTSRLVGISGENIPSGGTGKMIIAGRLETAGISLPHNTVIVVDPRNPGQLVARTSVAWLPTDVEMEAGTLNGSTLLVDIDRNAKARNAWRTATAGEAFNANETRLVRFAVDGEDAGRVYLADKSLANLDQKFWAVAFVQPTQAISAGDTVALYKEVELFGTETGFLPQDLGKPFYLNDDGNFASWNNIRNTYAVNDAIYKVGIIEDARKLIVDGSQMMGTAPGPMV